MVKLYLAWIPLWFDGKKQFLPWQWQMLGFQGYLGHQQSHRHVHRLLWQHWEIQTGGLFVTLPIWWRELRHNICFFVTFQATHKLFWHLKLKSKINNQRCHWPILEWLPLERVRVSGPMSCSAMVANDLSTSLRFLKCQKMCLRQLSVRKSINVFQQCLFLHRNPTCPLDFST